MTFQYCSDLHLEFPENKRFLLENPLPVKGDILLLAGDIVPFDLMDQHAWFFDFVSSHFEAAYWLPGNHEYYGSDAAERSGVLNERVRDNVFLVNNTSVQTGKINVIFSTLWSNIQPMNEWLIERGMSDFHEIRFQGGLFSAGIFNRFHREAMRFLQTEFSRPRTGKTIVVSHHVPTFLNYPPQYKTSILNEAFAVELFPLIENAPVDYWIYGHHHQPIPDFMIGNACICTNQLGYVRYGEHTKFDPARVIVI